jgi:hypothetical protein
MTITSTSDAKLVRGPLGTPLSLADLSPADTERWVIRRKAEIVVAVQGGLLTCKEACARYGLTAEEFSAWQAALHRHGLAGLKIKRLAYVRRRQAHGLG